ncbi:putative alkaline phosphatase synthesis transcriptional regulatory protein PhoP [Aedoeadaptatus nemausensis]|uniref:Putative alkaline phosphatase synthesis transcriptional regulatory protein PhoP n=1 Tax=Aedoeadaptatus nemausensis TaxID=2582829 RepID=A0A6V6Y190_9FIRM|nr:response regulator transcription factor [Peptoniphilus nemausensis]CAC9925184.1 putative alkaline phosphatase synthesis transcriptional regulatory protein PhoP [Peptoniphilus nemausensis]
MTKILLVEDEVSIRKFIKINLEREGFEVFEAGSGEEGLQVAEDKRPDIVLLDIMLPGIDGFEVCDRLRSSFPGLGIIMLTAKAEDYDKIMGLQSGTDDYLTKPFNPTELTLRIKSLERRLVKDGMKKKGNRYLESGKFKIDVYGHKFFKGEEEIELTPTEHEIVKLFMNNVNRALSRDEILNAVWGEEFLGDSKIVDVNIRRLRSKIEEDPAHPTYIETVWGVGYRWKTSR